MIKKDIIKKLVNIHNISAREAAAIFQTCLDEIAGALIKDDTVEFRRFGVFKTKKQKPRVIIHPITGKKIKRPAKKIILFETSSSLDKKLNSKIKL